MDNVITGEGGSDTLIGFGGDDELLGDWGWSPTRSAQAMTRSTVARATTGCSAITGPTA